MNLNTFWSLFFIIENCLKRNRAMLLYNIFSRFVFFKELNFFIEIFFYNILISIEYRLYKQKKSINIFFICILLFSKDYNLRIKKNFILNVDSMKKKKRFYIQIKHAKLLKLKIFNFSKWLSYRLILKQRFIVFILIFINFFNTSEAEMWFYFVLVADFGYLALIVEHSSMVLALWW